MADFELTVGDRLPALQVQALDKNGMPVNLTGCTVKFSMTEVGADVPTVDAAAVTVDDAVNGLMSYNWAIGDTDAAGVYKARFAVNDGTGKVQSVPQGDSFIEVKIS